MENNAPKALLMAGGILIAMLIISALVLFYSNLSYFQDRQDQDVKEQQIVEFNKEYTKYERDDLTLMDLKSIYNKIESYNTLHPDEKIEHNIPNVYAKINESFKEIEEADKLGYVFECTKVEYNSDRKVCGMYFAIVNNPI